MQKLVYDKTKNTVKLLNSDDGIIELFSDVVSVEPHGMCFVVKKIIGKDPRAAVVMMTPINNTNFIIKR